jgi:hypothetical protein
MLRSCLPGHEDGRLPRMMRIASPRPRVNAAGDGGVPVRSPTERRRAAYAAWFAYVAVALTCTAYLNRRVHLVPKWGVWYAADPHPYILLQLRSWLSGHLAVLPHPAGAGNDYLWGRGGMHTAWGLGVPILSLPFHLVGRLFGAPGFPDSSRFLCLYAITTAVLARALHRSSRDDSHGLIAAAGAAGFVMVFPTYVGLLASRFEIYEQTIAIGALWCVLLMAGVLSLLAGCTTASLAAVCAAAGFSAMLRPPLAIYGLTTAVLALFIARRKGATGGALVTGAAIYVAFAALYFIGNTLRFGAPLNAGYENVVAGTFVGRMARWGVSFMKVPYGTALKEMFATLFLLDPIHTPTGVPPAAIGPFARGERWREYYSPGFDVPTFGVVVAAIFVVGWRGVRHRLWQSGRTLDDERAVILGAWALPPALVLFVFYARVGTIVTRYLTDLYPAFAAAWLCVGMVVVDAVRKRAPGRAAAAQVAIAAGAVFYLTARGFIHSSWVHGLSSPVDRKTVIERVTAIDERAAETPVVPDQFQCKVARGRPMHTQFDGWHDDCSFSSGMVWEMPHRPCVTFTFLPEADTWQPLDLESLAAFRANADSDRLVACGPPVADGDARRVTMCDPHPPPYLLDGMRLYAVSSLDEKLRPIDRLRLNAIDAVPSCPEGAHGPLGLSP